jgi:hypothetical protein
MSFRIKLGRHLSWGATGFRFHIGGHGVSASTGRSGWRIFARTGPFYGNWSGRNR